MKLFRDFDQIDHGSEVDQKKSFKLFSGSKRPSRDLQAIEIPTRKACNFNEDFKNFIKK